MKAPRFLLWLAATCVLLLGLSARAEKLTIAAAADLKFAMDEIVTTFKATQPGHPIDVVYGSSGKFQTQIQQGAPYDIYFSADIAFPIALAKAGFAGGEVTPYAIGRLVLWSTSLDAAHMTLGSLTDPKLTRIAIANPKHAPYGKRAEEALRAVGLWDKLESRLVYGENIAQTAQYVQSGNAQVGLIALSLAVSPELASQGSYGLIPDALHSPLTQGFVITKRAKDNPVAKQFADFMASKAARSVLVRYGFTLPSETLRK